MNDEIQVSDDDMKRYLKDEFDITDGDSLFTKAHLLDHPKYSEYVLAIKSADAALELARRRAKSDYYEALQEANHEWAEAKERLMSDLLAALDAVTLAEWYECAQERQAKEWRDYE